jgi:uncharacterized protein (TIGR02265 family)
MSGLGTAQDEPLKFGSREELEQRLSLIPSGDKVRGFLFATTLDAVREQADEAALQRCVKAAEGLSYIPFFNYSMHALLRLLYTAAWELADRHGDFEKALRHLGARTAPDFLQSAVGKMLLTMSGLDVKRLVSGIPVAYPTIYDHGSCTLRWTGMTSCQLLLQSNLIPPPFIEGGVGRVLQASRARGLVVQARRVALRENELSVSWE